MNGTRLESGRPALERDEQGIQVKSARCGGFLVLDGREIEVGAVVTAGHGFRIGRCHPSAGATDG